MEEVPFKDYTADGIKVAHDDDDSFMFVKLLSANKKDLDKLYSFGYSLDDILIIRRIAKIPFVGDKYIVSIKDILGGLTTEEYDNL